MNVSTVAERLDVLAPEFTVTPGGHFRRHKARSLQPFSAISRICSREYLPTMSG